MPPVNAAEWRDLLVHRLDERWAKLKVYDAYYEGDQNIAFMTAKYAAAYGGMFAELADNWMTMVVDSSVERLKVQGIRFGKEQKADEDAWSIWQDNGLDGESNMLHTEAVKTGWAYWMVQPTEGDKSPRITGEHPSQCIVATDPADRRIRVAALKKWRDGDYIYANVYLPDRVVKYRTTQRRIQTTQFGDAKRWESIGASSNPLKDVPLVPVPNNPAMLHGGVSDLARGAIKLQNAINKMLGDMLIGSEYIAYPLRVLLGVDIPRDPATGEPIPNADLALSQSRMLILPGQASEMDVKEFSAGDLKNFSDQVQVLADHLAAQTRTPPHYVVGKMANMSGDALKGAETGLVAKVRSGKMEPFGEAHETTLRLAFKAKDPSDERANETEAEIIWGDPESRSQAELADALTKLSAIGVPQEILWSRYGFSPAEIDRMKAIQEEEALRLQALQPQTPQEPNLNGSQPAEPSRNGGVPSQAVQPSQPARAAS